MKCFIDLDGVLANFSKAAFELFGQKEPKEYPDEDWIPNCLGITNSAFWEKVDYNFWLNLEMLSDAQEILQTIHKYIPIENCCILTSPTLHGAAAHAKMEWILRYLPQFKRRFLIGACKEMCSYKGAILVDDLEKNVDDFNSCGGVGILLPRPWNRRKHLVDVIRTLDWELAKCCS